LVSLDQTPEDLDELLGEIRFVRYGIDATVAGIETAVLRPR
jgi:hypothetical protein